MNFVPLYALNDFVVGWFQLVPKVDPTKTFLNKFGLINQVPVEKRFITGSTSIIHQRNPYSSITILFLSGLKKIKLMISWYQNIIQ